MISLKNTFTRRELLWFGPLFGLFATMLGWIAVRKFESPGAAAGIGAVAAGTIAIYYLFPPLRRAIFTAWLALVFPLGWLLSHLILALVFYLVVLPIGLGARLCGYDALCRRLDRSAPSYWIRRKEPAEPEDYFRQF